MTPVLAKKIQLLELSAQALAMGSSPTLTKSLGMEDIYLTIVAY